MINIARYTPRGVLLDRVQIPYGPIPTDAALLGYLRERAVAHARQLPARLNVDPDDIFNTYWVPEYLPPVRAALADDEGYWLQREDVRRQRWERYDLRGQLVATVVLPASFTGLASRARTIVGSLRDTLGVHKLQKYELWFTP